jgi:tRNA-splicing ligase RtcB
MIIKGCKSSNYAKVFTENIEDVAIKQIEEYLNLRFIKGDKIRIMPDVHAGNGCVIGFTSTFDDYIIPNLVGVDIGCGVTSYCLGNIDIDLPKLDEIIRKEIPFGFSIHSKHNHLIDDDIENVKMQILYVKDPYLQLGTLGGGNHFIELGIDSNNNKWLTVHSGSRNFGLSVANFYQNKAKEFMNDYNINLPKGVEFLHKSNQFFDDYIYSVDILTQFAEKNRKLILTKITDKLNIKVLDSINSIHNYIDVDNKIIRKGAIKAELNNRLLIPFNMRDGIIIGLGKGNNDWNCSAPHGAGRIMSRINAKKVIRFEDYENTMKGVFSTCINTNTIDEAPQVYKDMEEIKIAIKDTVQIVDTIKPVYNFKAN